MKVILICKKRLSLTSEQIIDLIDPAVVADIKSKDPKPLFKAYILAAEGPAYPELVEENGSRRGGVVVWTKEAVKQLASKVISQVTKLFIGHTEFRNYMEAKAGADRVANAYVVGSAIIEQDGKDHNIIVAYFPEQSQQFAKDFDAVSMEVEYEAIEGSTGGRKTSIVESVLNVFGIALLKQGEEPAFDAARSVGVAYAQFYQDDTTNKREDKIERKNMDLATVHFNDLRDELLRRNARAWQLWTPEQIVKDDKGVSALFEAAKKEAAEQARAEMQEKLNGMESKLKELEPLQHKIRKYESAPVLRKKAQEKNLPKPVLDAIERKIERFEPGEDIDKSADAFIQQELEEYQHYAKSLGIDKQQDQPPLGGADESEPDDGSILGVDDA